MQALYCLTNPGACIETAVYSALTGVPWWVYALVILVALGAAWRLAGIPGLVATAAAVGYAFGRLRIPALPQKDAPKVQPWGSTNHPTPPDVDGPHETVWDKWIRGEKVD